MAPSVQFPFISVSSDLKGRKEGSAAGEGNYAGEGEKRLVGALVIFLPEPLFANVTYSLSEIIKCKTF